MFKINNLKIYFKRTKEKIYIKSLDESVERDITRCYIRSEIPQSYSICRPAILNPLDQYDKLTGKKMALTKTLKASRTIGLNKMERREIWLAFWTWVASWSPEREMQVHAMFNGYEKEKTKKE